MRRIAVAATLFCVAASALARQVDILITGGTVVTMAGPNIDHGAVAIEGHNIVAVGKAADIAKRFTARTTINASGMAVVPGFVNAHTHAALTLFRGIADDRDLMDWLNNYIFPAEAKNVTRDFVKWGTRLAAAEMIRSGTTTFADMYYFESDVAREAKAAGLRYVTDQIPGITSNILAEKINALGTPAQTFASLNDIFLHFTINSKLTTNNSLIITMGAGDIYKVAEQLVEE